MKQLSDYISERFGDHFTESNVLWTINNIKVKVENKDYYDRCVKYDQVNIEAIKTAMKTILDYLENPDKFNPNDFDIDRISFGLSSYKKHEDEMGFKFFRKDENQEIFMVKWYHYDDSWQKDKIAIADDKNDQAWFYNINNLKYIFKDILANHEKS